MNVNVAQEQLENSIREYYKTKRYNISTSKIPWFLDELNKALADFEFSVEETVLFLGACTWETDHFRTVVEYDKKWSETSYGPKYKGRGLIQCTHKRNYEAFEEWMKENELLLNQDDVVHEPELVESVAYYAVYSAIWYWTQHESEKGYPSSSGDSVGSVCRDIADVEDLSMETKTLMVNALIFRGDADYTKPSKGFGRKGRLELTQKLAKELGVSWE